MTHSATFIEEMKKRLLEEQARLETELSHFTHRQTPGDRVIADMPQTGESEDDNATEVAQFSDNLSLEEELEKAKRDVESALKMVANGTYGVCKYCHQPIDKRRLEARPTSSSCIECKKTLTQEI